MDFKSKRTNNEFLKFKIGCAAIHLKAFLYIKLLGCWEIYHHQITFSDLRECKMDTAEKPHVFLPFTILEI